MITINSKPEEIIKELKEGYQKASYWHIKHYGGQKKYDQMRDNLLRTKEDLKTGDIVEYIDNNGNRWRIFECCRYYPEAKMSYTNVMAFVYHETYQSCGAYVPTFRKDVCDGNEIEVMDVVYYTEHFFLRFCDRLGIKFKSSAMIKKFLEVAPGLTIQPRNEYMGKFQKADFALPASLGRGVIKPYGKGNIFEVKTYLTNAQLSPKQRRETEQLRKAAALNTLEPEDVRMSRAMNMGIDKFLDAEMERLVAMGSTRDEVETAMSLQTMASLTMLNLGYIRPNAFEAHRFGVAIVQDVANAQWRIRYEGFESSAILEVLVIIRDAAKNLHINVDLNKCAHYILKEFYKEEKTFTTMERQVEEYAKRIKEFDNGYLQGKAKQRK